MIQADIAAIRFGYGHAPGHAAATGADDLLADLSGPDAMAERFPRDASAGRLGAFRDFTRLRREQPDAPAVMDMRKALRGTRDGDLRTTLARAVAAPVGFRERLVAFWANHFSVAARGFTTGTLIGAYRDEAIRPHISGRFADMLVATVTHPAMLLYLDQQNSVGPNAPQARPGRGLNENLAREVLELHTLGVGAAYSQRDVTEFAKLLTGLRLGPEGMIYNPAMAEPGAETVLGERYAGETLDSVRAALEDIALRPETAAHIARKIAVHFVSDMPDAGLVAAMTDAYLAGDGALMPVYEAMLDHPAAWAAPMAKVKPPMDYVVSAARALGLDADVVAGLDGRALRIGFGLPLTKMGQPPFAPRGPDGWPEAPEDWITPATLAARIDWATRLARERAGRIDPRALLDKVLPGMAGADLAFAVAGTESGWEGVALILVSPEFNRR